MLQVTIDARIFRDLWQWVAAATDASGLSPELEQVHILTGHRVLPNYEPQEAMLPVEGPQSGAPGVWLFATDRFRMHWCAPDPRAVALEQDEQTRVSLPVTGMARAMRSWPKQRRDELCPVTILDPGDGDQVEVQVPGCRHWFDRFHSKQGFPTGKNLDLTRSMADASQPPVDVKAVRPGYLGDAASVAKKIAAESSFTTRMTGDGRPLLYQFTGRHETSHCGMLMPLRLPT